MSDLNDWEVEIIGDSTDLKQLTQSFTTQDLQIKEREGKYYLKSSRFDEIDDPGEVRRISKKLAEVLTGGSVLRLGTRSKMKVSGISNVKDQSRSTSVEANFLVASARMLAAATVIREDGKVEVSNPADSVREWEKITQECAAAKDVLGLYAEDQDWANLYRIYEIIEDDVDGPDEMARTGSVSKAKLRRFKHTANSRKAAGLNSRHPVEKTDPPKNPMTLNKAKSMMSRIAETWLNAKGK